MSIVHTALTDIVKVLEGKNEKVQMKKSKEGGEVGRRKSLKRCEEDVDGKELVGNEDKMAVQI